TGSDSETGTHHCREAEGHHARIAAAAQERAQRSAGKVEEKQQAGIRVAEMKARRKRWKQSAAHRMENTGQRKNRMKNGDTACRRRLECKMHQRLRRA